MASNYDKMKEFYSEFKNNPPEDKFTRYYKEYSFMNSLIEFAKKQGLEKDVFEYEKIQKSAVENLKKLGYKFI